MPVDPYGLEQFFPQRRGASVAHSLLRRGSRSPQSVLNALAQSGVVSSLNSRPRTFDDPESPQSNWYTPSGYHAGNINENTPFDLQVGRLGRRPAAVAGPTLPRRGTTLAPPANVYSQIAGKQAARQQQVEQMATRGPQAENMNDRMAELQAIRDRVEAIKARTASTRLAQSQGDPMLGAAMGRKQLDVAQQQFDRNIAAMQSRAGMEPQSSDALADLISTSNRSNELNNYARGSHLVRLSSARPHMIPARIDDENAQLAAAALPATFNRSSQTAGQLAKEKARTAATKERVASAIKARQQSVGTGGGGGGANPFGAYQALVQSGVSPNVAADIVDRQTRSQTESGLQRSQLAAELGLKRDSLNADRELGRSRMQNDERITDLKAREIYAQAYAQSKLENPDAEPEEHAAYASRIAGTSLVSPAGAAPSPVAATPGSPPPMAQAARDAQRFAEDPLMQLLGITPEMGDDELAGSVLSRAGTPKEIDDKTLGLIAKGRSGRMIQPGYEASESPMHSDLFKILTDFSGDRPQRIQKLLKDYKMEQRRRMGADEAYNSHSGFSGSY